MRLEVALSLLALMVAAVAGEKTKERHHKSSSWPTLPPIADGKTPFKDLGVPPLEGGHHVPHGSKEGRGKSHEGAAALKEEIMRIKSSDIPDEEKKARLHQLRMRVKEGQALQQMPPEVRARHQELQATLKGIYHNEELTEEQKTQQIADAKQKFKDDMTTFRDSLTSEQIQEMREERKKTIEGHTAAAMAAKQVGRTKMAREFQRRAKEAAKGGSQRKRRGAKPSLSKPVDFF